MTKAFEFTNENNEKISIYCDVKVDGFGVPDIKYRVSDIMVTPYRKRKEISISAKIRESYLYRSLPHTGGQRQKYIKDEFLKFVSEDQITQAITYMYNLLQPNDTNIDYWII